MLVPVSYHEPFASSKHGLHTDPTTCIFGLLRAHIERRQDCPGAFATPTLCHILQKQTCFVADACPCQLPWAVCKQQRTAGVSYTRHLTVGGPCPVDWIPRSRQYFWYQPSSMNAWYIICLCQQVDRTVHTHGTTEVYDIGGYWYMLEQIAFRVKHVVHSWFSTSHALWHFCKDTYSI